MYCLRPQHDVEDLDPLERRGIETLYDRKGKISDELMKLRSRLLTAITDSLACLERAGEGVRGPVANDLHRAIETVKMISINMHHLVNIYRPLQARALIVRRLEKQVERNRKTLDAITEACEEHRKVFGNSDGETTVLDREGE